MKIIVDREEEGLLAKYNWRLVRGYAVATIDSKQVSMHRLLLGVTDPKVHVDHINQNRADNRRSNLRLCNQSQNQANRKVKGFTITKHGKYRVLVCKHRIRKHIGYFDTQKEAEEAYKKAKIELFGEFAHV
jgi:hypothetical protein